MGVDITTELQIIRTVDGGDAVKAAIRSALNKIAQTRGGEVVKEFDKGVTFDAPVGTFGLEEIGAVSDWYDSPTLVFTFTAVRSSSSGYAQMSEIYFYDSESNQVLADVASLTTNGISSWSSEGVNNILDGNINTKWCWQWANPTTLTISMNSDLRPSYISYVTGNDLEDRDPISFTVDYYYQTYHKKILTVTNATITTSRKTETQKFECNWD